MRFKSVIPDHSRKNDRTITQSGRKAQDGRNLNERLLDFHAKRIISYFLDTFNLTLIIMIQFFDWLKIKKLKLYTERKGLMIFEGVYSNNKNNLSAMPLFIQRQW